MWPFCSKKKEDNSGTSASVSEAFEHLAHIGIRARAGISHDDLLYSLDGTMESPVDWVNLLCVLGSEVERGEFQRVSDDIWHFDAECIEGHGAYVTVLGRFVVLTKGILPLIDIRDHVDIDGGKAWVEFALEGKKYHWDMKLSDDWVDPELYSRLQQLVTLRGLSDTGNVLRLTPLPNRRALPQSRRDCVIQPRVARHELPWVNRQRGQQPQRGCGMPHSFPIDATPLGLKSFLRAGPRVARSSQPWANGWNPVGIPPQPRVRNTTSFHPQSA